LRPAVRSISSVAEVTHIINIKILESAKTVAAAELLTVVDKIAVSESRFHPDILTATTMYVQLQIIGSVLLGTLNSLHYTVVVVVVVVDGNCNILSNTAVV